MWALVKCWEGKGLCVIFQRALFLSDSQQLGFHSLHAKTAMVRSINFGLIEESMMTLDAVLCMFCIIFITCY